MSAPTRAIILAAGLGTRMRPLTHDLPKPLMPFWGRPVLEHAIRMLADWGVTDIAINCHHRAADIIEWTRTHPVPGVSLNLSYEPEILGTGGPLRRLQWFIGDQPFWLFNADVVAELDPAPLLRAFAGRQRPLAALWMHRERGPRTVEIRDGAVSRFIAEQPGSEHTATFCGLHLLDDRVLDYLPGTACFHSIIRAYMDAMAQGARIAAVESPGSFWSDLGTPGQYLEAHREVHARRKRSRLYRKPPPLPRGVVTGFASVGTGVRVSPRAKLHDVVLWDGASAATGSRAHELVAGRGAVVRGAAFHITVPAELALLPEERNALGKAGWRLDRLGAMVFPARGSDRAYYRIHDGSRRAILLRYGTERDENLHYVKQARFLDRAGIRVPRVVLDRPRDRFTVLEDLGDTDLLSLTGALSERALLGRYEKVIDLVARLHDEKTWARARRVKLPTQPGFGRKLFDWEHRYFDTHFLHGELELPERMRARIRRELRSVSRVLEAARYGLVHRDLQSTNVFFVQGDAVLIDFQGMRPGPPAYDLASLLADPYVSLSPRLQARLLDRYITVSGNTELREQFGPACVQRLGQALGAYARLGKQRGTERFREHLPAGRKLMLRALDTVQGCEILKSVLGEACTK